MKDGYELPPDFLIAPEKNPVALEKFSNYGNSNKFIFIPRIIKIKTPELLERKIRRAVELIENNQKSNDTNDRSLL